MECCVTVPALTASKMWRESPCREDLSLSGKKKIYGGAGKIYVLLFITVAFLDLVTGLYKLFMLEDDVRRYICLYQLHSTYETW